MRDIIDLHHLQALGADGAAALMAARLSDPTGPHDGALLDEWLAQDEAHRAAWDRTQRALFLIDHAQGEDLLAELRRAARDAVPARRQAWPRWAAAAAVVVALAGGSAYVMMDRAGLAPRQVATAAAQSPIYRTARGEVREVTLPDGSKVTLDTDSAVQVAFVDKRRDLSLLKGRAFFAVHHDRSRPFAVHAGGHEVIAVGTKFDVRLDPGRFQVVLIEGRVSVGATSGDTALTYLDPGQQLIVRDGEPPVVSSGAVDAAGDWRERMATFQDAPLSDVAAELNRYSSDRLIVRDPRLARLRVTGVFRTGDLARFGRTLEQVYPVRVVHNGPQEWEIVPAGDAAKK